MNAFDELYDLDKKLRDDEEWLQAIENALYDKGVDSLDELVGICVEEEDETIIYVLIDAGESIIMEKDQNSLEWFDGLDEEDY